MGEVLADYASDLLRFKYFVRESAEHGAKLELRTFIWIVEKYTAPGDTILDPMSGIGTVHYAATMGRNTIGCEIGQRFQEIHEMNIEKLGREVGFTGIVTLNKGDCRRFLPIVPPLDCVIFSPPYGSVMAGEAKSGFKNTHFGYSDEDANVGNIPTYPLYLLAMREIYRLCFQSLKPGGVMISICKDYISKGDRVFVSKDNAKMCIEVGFILEDWHLRNVPMKGHTQGQHAKRRQAKGTDRQELHVEVEDLLVLRKPVV